MKRTRSVVAVSLAGLALVVGLLFTSPQVVLAHCQIPCGIYDDAMRFTMLEEHITTIEKSMNQVVALAENPSENANQLVRWVVNKENHADYFAEIVTQYFLQQRIKPVEPGNGPEREAYIEKVTLCHQMLVATMKAKQTTDLQYVAQLRSLVAAFRRAYFTPEEEKKLEEDKRHGTHTH